MRTLAIVVLWLLPLAGCGGRANSTSTPAAQPTTLIFTSARALDGSAAANTNSTSNVWVVKADGSGATPLTKLTASGANIFADGSSPDGSKILMDSRRALDGSDAGNTNGTNNIWVVKSDGTGATALTKLTASGADSFSPVWSPDGSKIAFDSHRALDGSDASNTNGTSNIWVVNADGSGAAPLTKLTSSLADSSGPVWSPDGSKIAFASHRALDGSDAANTNSTLNIWVMKSDGSGATPLTQLTAAGAVSFVPTWSPDGSKIAFLSERALDGSNAAGTPNTPNIWAMKADGSGATPLTRLTALAAGSGDLVWSPDGSKIAFDSRRALDGSDAVNTSKAFNIWMMNSDGTAATPLTRLTAVNSDSFDPAWSRDGSKIGFDSQRALDGSNAANTNNVSNIWLMNADGSGPVSLTNLTALNADSCCPGWKP